VTAPDLTHDQATDLVGTPEPEAPHTHELVRRLEGNESLDAASSALAGLLPEWVVTGQGRDLLSGRWLGHALHPLLTDFPLGCWTGASLLDLLGPRRHADAARKLVGLGILASLPTAAAGLSDWSRLGTRDRRVGVAHAQANSVGLVLYGASYLARRRGHRWRGILLSVLGGLAATAGGYLGGHLTTTRSVTRDNRLLDAPPTGR
jgi:uncharacterized membrane protein